MDWDGRIVAKELLCSVSGRALAPGEVFFAGLMPGVDGLYLRQVFAAEVWEQQDRSRFISWWRQTVPAADQSRRSLRLNADTLIQIFANLRESGERSEQCLAYVVALALVRARKLQFRGSEDQGGRSLMILEDRAHGLIHRVRDPGLTPDEEARVLDNLLAVAGLAPLAD